MAERNLPAALKTSLIANEEYTYLHLVKFEKPRSSATGLIAGKATDYAYITDAAVNVSFDDGSVDSRNNANGTQTYVANKLLKVGTVSETTEARASNISLTLSGTALGTIVTTNLAFTTSTIGTTIDMVEAGFQEGDTILLERAGGGNNNKYVRIDRFTNDNKTLHVTPIDTSPLTANATSLEYTVSYASEEIAGLILSKEATNYSNYLNREAFIYRAHMDPETGDIIGEPFLIFRGIISKGSVTDNALQSSKVVWNLTSHWGDFVRIQGRMTSDSAHRALSVTGEPDVDALIRPEYAQDTGFMHAEQSINIMAIYQAMETRYKMKKRGGLAGLLGGKKLVEYEVEVDREVDLQFNLSSKYLPVVYGVQKVDSIPIFADTLRSDSSTIYVAHALCEGEIGGIYDIHIDDASTVCVDKADYDVRAGGGETIEIVCNGRADRGDVLAGSTYTTGVPLYWDQVQYAGDFWGYNWGWYNTYFDVTNNAQGAQGIQHEETYTFTSPIDTDLVIHTGKPDQKANSELVKVAAANNFKVQNDYYEGSLSDYWGPSHRLLDTAYVVGKYKVSEGEVTLPKLEFVVRGKVLECYNYDYSYLADDYQPDGTQSDFSIGDNVTIHRTSNDAQVGSTVMIIDKWSYYNTEGELSYRFRFSSNPQATDANPPTAFYMKNTSGDKWYMTTYDHQEASLVDIGTNPTATVTSAARTAGKLTLVLNSPSTAVEATLSAGKAVALTFEEVDTTTSYEIVSYNSTTDTLVLTDSGFGTSAIVTNINTNGFTCTVEPLSYLTLDSGDNATNYTGRTITLSRFDTNDAITHQETRVVTGYNSITKLATLDSPWPPTFIPTSGDTYSVSSKGDKRVSINPVVQLLDYLTSARYGKGLKQSDLNLPTFMESARLCDTQSDVTVQLPSTENISVGDEYRYAPSGRLVFQGTVRSVENVATYVNGTLTNFKQVTFKDVIGKLAYKWNDWRSYTAGDYVWNNGSVYLASGGTLPTAPTTGALSSITLSKVSGSGDPIVDISITDGYTSSGNPIIKKFTNTYEGFNSPGYSLYDSDDVKYWIYLGWDEPEQRFVTRHQMNQVINTSTPLFDNINSMLLQFNGIMRYANGKYEIGIKSAAPETFETYQTISEGDIIGDIKVQDKGQKSVYNSMAANIVDPQNKFAARSITFFNSDYLKEDKGIRRSGNFAMPGISNYYNARINIKQYLDESRYGLDISFTIDSKGYLLLTGEIIQVSYPRFNWSNKLFRVDNLNFQENGLVQVTATEHNDYAFLIGNIKSSPSAKRGEASGGSANPTAVATPAGPTNLAATTGGKGAIDLTWDNSASFKFATHNTEVWAASTNDRTQASLIYTTQATNLSHIVTEQSEVTKYYWVRHIVVSENNLSVPSDYYPLGSTSGIEGSATGAIDGTSGERGAGRWHIQVTALPTTSAEAATAWGSGSGNQPDAEVADDQAWFYTGTLSNPTSQTVWIYDGSSWNKQEEVIDGDLIVAGTITADQIKANTITANEINAEVGNFGQLVADIGTFGSIDTDTLDANSVIAREIQVFPEGGTAPTIDGTTLAGAGVDIKQDGDVYIGDASADKYVFWDQSEGTLTLRGELNAGDITAGTISADRISAGSIDADKIAAGAITADKIDADAVTAEKIDVTNLAAVSADLGAITAGTMQNSGVNAIPDADTAPTGSESGAFIDLTQGKFVFGDASKYILWDGTDLTLSGVAIDASSTIDAIAGVTVQEDGTQELEAATTFNFTTGLNVETNATTKVATISVDSTDSNDYVNSASFSGGTLTLGRTGTNSLGDITVSLDGRYLQAESDTLDSVTGRGASTNNNITVGSLTVGGDLTVSGTTTTVNTETINLADNILTLNSNATGLPSENAGIEVARGTSNNVSLLWNEGTDRWQFSNGTTTYNIPITSEYDKYSSWTAGVGATTKNIISGGSLSFAGSNGITASYNTTTNTITFDGAGTANNYVSSAAFDTGTGVLTLNREGLTAVTVDLDGRYLESYIETKVGISGAQTSGIVTLQGSGAASVTQSGTTITISSSDTWRPIHDTPVDGATTTSISSNWAFDNVKTAVPANAVFTDTWRPIHDSPVDGATGTSISSNWAFDNVKTAVPANAVFTDTDTVTSVGISGSETTGTVTIAASGASSVSQSGNTITISSTDTNTWRAIHDTPVDGATTTSISSNWAFDNVKTAVPANAVFTDTITSVGVSGSQVSGTVTIAASGASSVSQSGNTITISSTDTNTWRAIHDTPVDGATTTSISSNWAFDNVKTAVPANAVFTDTTYSVGDGGLTEKNFTAALQTKLGGIEANADVTDTANVVAALTAGTNITIAANGTISATDTNTTYSAGALLDLTGTTFDVDLTELTDKTTAMVTTDEFVVIDSGGQKRKAISEIDASLFDTSSLSSADADKLGGQPSSYYLSTDTEFSGDVTGTWNSLSVTNDSHTHDGRYYTETEIGNLFSGTTAITGYSKSNWDTAYGWGNHANAGYASYDHIRSLGATAFTGGVDTTITTTDLMAEIDTDGGFDSYSSVFKTSWSYAGNKDLSDAGRFTETAGTSWITWTDSSSDTTRGNITALAIAPNTGGSAGKVFIYNDQGAGYSPGWREVWTSASDGSGSGLDADTVDGKQASVFALKTADASINMSNFDITNVNNIQIGDPGPGEGITWAGGNLWKIYESPNDLSTNGAGNLQIVQNATRRATFNTSGQLELPVAAGTAPLVITSTTAVANLNADLLDGNHASAFATAGHNHDTTYLGINAKAADSEKVDGIDSTRIVYGSNQSGSNGTSTTQNVYDLAQYKSGMWDSNGGDWTPTTAWYWGGTFAHQSNSSTYNYSGQIAFLNGGGGNSVHLRTISNGTPSDWQKIWTTGNDGSGSGLDADTVDGKHASDFALSGHSHSYLPLAGGTLTGDLTTTSGSGNGVFIGTSGANITSVTPASKDITIQNVAQLRFGNTSDWDWNKWAGIVYDAANLTLTIGGPASSSFTSNASPSNITINFDGIATNGFKVNGTVAQLTDTWRPIHDSPVDGATTTSISSNWAFDNVKTAVPASAVFTDTVTSVGVSGSEVSGTVTIAASGASSVAQSGNTITISSTDTNTWRPIHDSPVDGATTTSISSNWAFDNVKTAVPANAVFTDTDTITSVGVSGSEVSGTVTIQQSGATTVTQSGNTITISSTDTNTWRGIHDSPVDGATTTSISSNWAFDNVKTAVPANAVFTDTTYSAAASGGLSLSGTAFSVDDSVMRGVKKTWSSITGSSNDWFPIFQFNDSTDGAVHCVLKSYAHSSVAFVATCGYSGSNTNSITVLNSNYNANGGYANVKALRIRNNGVVEAQFGWTSGPTTSIEMQAWSADDAGFTVYTALETTTQTATVNDTVSVNMRGLLRGYTIKQGSNDVWDSGDFSSTDIGNWNTAHGWGNHANAGYLTSVPTATASVLGGIKVGDRLTITNGVLSADVQSTTYTLPTATASVLGGIKVGDRLTITNGVLSADVQSSSYTLPTASTTVKGGVKVGTNLEMNGEAIQLKNGSANFDSITAAVGTFTTVDTEVLNADSVIARTVQVYPDGGTAPTITGTTLAGSGAVIKSDGDVMIGDSAGKHIFYDQSAGSLAIRSGTSGSRTEFLGDVIKVFDGTTLRVKIGNLSA